MRVALLLVLSLALLFGGCVMAGTALALVGEPRACGDGDAGRLTPTDVRAATATLGDLFTGQQRLTLSNQAATLTARGYVATRGLALTEVKVGFCDGRIETSARRDLLTGIHTRVVARPVIAEGRLEYRIEQARIGALSGWPARWLARRYARANELEHFAVPPWVTGVEVGEGTLRFTAAGR